MPKCPGCASEIPENSRFCFVCGDATRTSASTIAIASSSSADFDEGRFVPGTLLAERYRILGRLGKGGMGEVYRANDLRLGQTVALKFLPETTAKDPGMLARFYNEVRIARQVTHPNVCRVFDIGDVDGQPFISMQFVDGENLASLLLRIGRLPADKAVELSRRLCAGLAAAHSQGVLHRDLKPANIMIDGRGQVLITDFGLAGIEEEIRGADIHSGTPAYMAPEQLAGKEVSSKSDIYALGLVMYEMFTGKRAFEADTLADLIRVREESRPTEISSQVRDVDPAVERIILKCLDPDPQKRPAGALAVSAALPGGDPLAAALAAGETPSPEMVAAAGAQEGLKPALAIACLAAVLIALGANVILESEQNLASKVNFELPPDALAVQARKTIRQFGYSGPIADRAFTFDYAGDYLYYLEQHSKQALDWNAIGAGQPPPIHFSYRESPQLLEPQYFARLGRISENDPTPDVSGMAHMTLDLTGRLLSFSAVPPQLDTSLPVAHEPDPAPLFAAAGLDLKLFQPATPQWTPLAATDFRAAWTGVFPNTPSNAIRVEAAWWRGKPVYFQIVGPWTQPNRMPSKGGSRRDYTWIILVIAAAVSAPLMAWRNLRLGRGDRQGGLRLAGFAFTASLASFVLRAHFVATFWSFSLFIEAVGQALWIGLLLWLAYIALEPVVRRIWPRSLISWTRLLSGRWQDPLVARDVLIGLLVGLGYDLVFAASNAIELRMGASPPAAAKLDALLGLSRAFYPILDRMLDGLTASLLFFLLFFLFRLVLRKEWLAGIAFVVLFVAVRGISDSYPLADIPAVIIVYAVVVFMLLRCGLLALVVTIFITDLIGGLVFTTNFSAWYGTPSLVCVVLVSGLAIFAFRKSLGGHRISAALLDQ
jgi:Protein kinase domain